MLIERIDEHLHGVESIVVSIFGKGRRLLSCENNRRGHLEEKVPVDMYLLSRKGAMENMLTGDDDHHNSRSEIPWKHAMKKLHPIQM